MNQLVLCVFFGGTRCTTKSKRFVRYLFVRVFVAHLKFNERMIYSIVIFGDSMADKTIVHCIRGPSQMDIRQDNYMYLEE